MKQAGQSDTGQQRQSGGAGFKYNTEQDTGETNFLTGT